MGALYTRLPRFRGEPAELRDKLNAMVDRLDAISALFGDRFIEIHETTGGRTVGINIDRLMETMPKLPPRPATDAILFWNAATSTLEWIPTTDECPT